MGNFSFSQLSETILHPVVIILCLSFLYLFLLVAPYWFWINKEPNALKSHGV